MRQSIKAREGDLVETLDGNIFDVKGLVHPPEKVVAFIRFTPDSEGERKRDDIAYRKVYSLQERYELLRKRFPRYLVFDDVFDELLCEVPVALVKKHYIPIKGLKNLRRRSLLDEVEADALKFAGLLKKNAGVSWSQLGVSGSVLVGLHTSSSDIDLTIYGSKNCHRIYATLKSLMQQKDSPVKRYTPEELKRLFQFRSKDTLMPFEDFLRTESRKVLQGTFKQRDYFIRCVKDWNEIDENYGRVRYKSLGYARIQATVTDDSETIFTPCSYKIADVKVVKGVHVKPLNEIVSFRGRFCEQARNGETVIAQGKVERVQRQDGKEHVRLLLGNKPSDFMFPLNNQPGS
jgi:hypothetical protein